MERLDFIVEQGSLEKGYECLILVGESTNEKCYPEFVEPYLQKINAHVEVDGSAANGTTGLVTGLQVPFLVYSSTGPTNRDYDDSRRYQEAAANGVKRALKSGKKSILVVVYSCDNTPPKYKDAVLVSLLGSLEALYVPIEVREGVPEKAKKVERIGFASTFFKTPETAADLINKACAIEYGRIVARDIGGSDPERMCPILVEKHVTQVFQNSNITVKVTSGFETLVKDYPLFAAVDRCANEVERHRGRVIYLEYSSGDDVETTYYFVGKGVTYDTGGADVKAGGHMAGMHRDKCGAATVAGIFAILNELKPKGVKVVGRMAVVRNSVGAESYVADEIITSRAGVRVRIGNTDAEGRMAMTDPLQHCKEEALSAKNPHLFTIATLTGHAIVAMGPKYSIVVDNGPAEQSNFARNLQTIGDGLADPFEVSTLRREDYEFIAARNEYEDVLQCNNIPSSATPRGHQFPAAFMARASGLDNHGIDSETPLKYSHIDIAGSSGPYPGMPTGCPIPSIARLLKMI